MEPLSRDAVRAAPRISAHPAPPLLFVPSAATATPVRVRLGLQRRAQANLRRHFLRALRRFVVLVVADLASFWVMRELVRAVRDHAVLGEWLAGPMSRVMPTGILNGWQFAAALFVGLLILGNYGQGDQRRDPRRLFLACALATALPLWMTIWTRGLEVVLLQYALTTVLVWLGLLVERQTIDQIVARVVPAARHASQTLFVGPAEDCRAVASSRAFTSGSEHVPIGFVDVQLPPAADSVGNIHDFASLLNDLAAETVVICGHLLETRLSEVVDASLAAGCRLLSVPRVTEIAGVQPNLFWRNDQPLIELTAPSLKGWQLAVKRAMDVTGAAIGLVLFAPLFGIVALLVKLDSRGPILFRQQRVGRGGRLFRIAKFRTMNLDAEQHRGDLQERSIYADARLFKIPNDPRITALGRWLRRTSLDELPQLVNVLRGGMSLVGPRPPVPSEVELYEAHHYARFDVKPGITGPWQVSGRNEIKDFEEVVALETRYIHEWSIWRDLAILARTLGVVVRMKGAL